MINNNSFYVLRGTRLSLNNTYMWDEKGNSVLSENGIYSSDIFSIPQKYNRNEMPIFMINPAISFESLRIYSFNKQGFLGYIDYNKYSTRIIKLNKLTTAVSINIKPVFDTENLKEDEIKRLNTQIWFYVGTQVTPHYKSLKLKYKKETNQEFFRETVDGSIKLYGKDFDYVDAANIEEELLFSIYDKNSLFVAAGKFSKTDCKFNITKKSVEFKLSPIDKYTKIMNKYENTYDLLKIGVPITPIKLYKRFAIQTYILGANSYSCFSSNGMYFEDEVSEIIDDEKLMLNKYYFAKSVSFHEINIDLPDVFPRILTYKCINQGLEWPSDVYYKNSSLIKCISYIKLVKVKSKGNTATIDILTYLKDATTGNAGTADTEGCYKHDVYKFELRVRTYSDEELLEDALLYHSFNYYYMIPSDWRIGEDVKIKMVKDDAATGPDSFEIDGSITYDVYARLICDVDSFVFNNTTVKTYNYPYDDFIIDKANYKKCIGIMGNVVNFYQSSVTVKIPTKFGINNIGEYFTSNFNEAFIGSNIFNRPMPVSRSSWGNTSIWAIFNRNIISDIDNACKKEYTIKDAYKLSDVIRAILNKIDNNVVHKNNSVCSSFLHGSANNIPDSNTSLVDKEVFIIPKSNILKGNYDQAAQKAEITLKQVMDMLAYCFKAYWYIDNNSNFVIEHIKYFANGFSYSNPNVSDIIKYVDKFNKKNILFCQTELDYNKSDLQSRFEFEWMDDSSDIFEGPKIDVISSYVQEDKTESVVPENFSSDIDLMLLAPDKFSSDGFALIVASKNNNTYETPITGIESLHDEDYKYPYDSRPQNYYASWTFLENYYMYDMPAKTIEYDLLLKNSLQVKNVYRSMSHDIEFQCSYKPDLNHLYKTEIGNGKIEEMTYNIDTKLTSLSLVYEPK